MLAGAAIFAGATYTLAAQAQRAGAGNDDEAAMMVPRVTPYGGGVVLPRPLAPSQAVLVRRIFAQQAAGRMAEADQAIAQLDDPLLIGHLRADRYLGRFHRATADELVAWLSRYGSLPDAPAIHALLLKRLPKGMAAPPKPGMAALPTLAALPAAPPEEIDDALRALPGDATGAPIHAALQAGMQARTLFTQNRDEAALELAGAAFRRGPAAGKVGYAGLIAGLAAWRLERPDLARRYFEDAARAPMAAPAVRAAAAYWAARANTRTDHPSGFVPWLRRAAQEKRTFYGILARRALGQDPGLAWQREILGQADIDAVDTTPAGRRAFALLQVGETQRAEAELRQLWAASLAADTPPRPEFARALMLVAREADMIDFAAQLATVLQAADGRQHDEMRFALPRLAPRGGFRVDPALVYALTRLESNFDAAAVSPAGARGLMQLMPVTASYVARDSGFASERLHDPAINLELGQRYLVYLSEQEQIGANLVRLLASYNSGPGSFARWASQVRDRDDPLLFIEAIPNGETRQFVQRALAYSWIYAARMHKPAPGLSELAAGAYPRFTTRDAAGARAIALH